MKQDGYEIVNQVLELSAANAKYAMKMLAKAKVTGNPSAIARWTKILNQAGRALKVR